jgi:hypothetical protein
MRGGAQAHLMRCKDENHYVVKFQNNPQHLRILVNELLGSRLAARLGLPTAAVAIVEVTQELIELTPELCIQLGQKSAPCRSGFQFGSRYPGRPGETAVFDFLPDDQLGEVENLDDFAGMLVFDKWTCNTNGRQAIFYRETGHTNYVAQMIDHGFCFNAGEWGFPDAPLRGIYARRRVYQSVKGIKTFEPWLARLETNVTESLFDKIIEEIPGEWVEFQHDDLFQLCEQLLRRKKLVPELILAAKHTYREPFPNWR